MYLSKGGKWKVVMHLSRSSSSFLLTAFASSTSSIGGQRIFKVCNIHHLMNNVAAQNFISRWRWSSTSSTRIFNENQEHSCMKELGESTLFRQEGTNIQEVPVAVLRDSQCKGTGKPFIDLDPTEEAAFVEGFNSFHSPKEVLSILHTIPSQEVTPVIALSILRKLFELENNFIFRSEGKSWVITTENSSMETFARMAIVSRLIDILIVADNITVILDALDLLRSDRKSIAANIIRLPNEEGNGIYSAGNVDILEFSKYRSSLCDQILIRTTKGHLSVEEVCRAVCTMGQMIQLFPKELEKGFIDKMWIGISDKCGDIDEHNITSVFRALQYFQTSQRLVMAIVERKFLFLSWKMNTATVAEICDLLLMKDTPKRYNFGTPRVYWGVVSNRLLASLSKCIHMNLHQVSEEELLKVTKTFSALDFCDAAFQKTLSKYVKARCLKISNANLLETIMDYVKKFRIRSSHILEGVAEYLLHNSSGSINLTPSQLSAILIPFGLFDYQPPHGLKFWEIVERLLSEKFTEMPPKDVIDSLLSCIYLQKYPLNFISRMFSPYFLDRLHTSETDINVLHQVRSNLKLLDTALTLECGAKYNGPYLPRDFTAKSVFVDGRILRMTHCLQEPLASIYKSSYTIEYSVVLPNLPLNALYIVNFLISPKISKQKSVNLTVNNVTDERMTESTQVSTVEAIASPQSHSHIVLKDRFNLRKPDSGYYVPIKSNGDFTVILINIPEHYASDGKTLLGPQVMRIRHLKLLGFNVVNLSHESWVAIQGSPQAVIDYLKNNLKIG